MEDLGDLFGGIGEIFKGLGEAVDGEAVGGIVGAFGGGRSREGYDETSTYERYLCGDRRRLNINDQ